MGGVATYDLDSLFETAPKKPDFTEGTVRQSSKLTVNDVINWTYGRGSVINLIANGDDIADGLKNGIFIEKEDLSDKLTIKPGEYPYGMLAFVFGEKLYQTGAKVLCRKGARLIEMLNDAEPLGRPKTVSIVSVKSAANRNYYDFNVQR